MINRFVIFSDKEKTIFFSQEKEPKAYEVYGIYDEILDLIPFEPIMVDAVLIPFREKITYNGAFRLYSISFGGGYRRGLKGDFMQSKTKFGIISSLDKPIQEKVQSEEGLFRFYLKNKQKREEFWNEINNMLRKNSNLKNIYHNEIGKSYVRETKKILSEIKVKNGWFAIVNSKIVASGKNEQEIKERLKDVLPEDKLDSAYIFEYKEKQNEKE